MWDSENEEEVETARDTFNKLKKKKYNAYAVKKDGEKGNGEEIQKRLSA